MKNIGTINCPSPDGDFELTVTDMVGAATGYILIRQEGQGQIHEIMLNRNEALQLTEIIEAWS
jgi:hypothetical protein